MCENAIWLILTWFGLCLLYYRGEHTAAMVEAGILSTIVTLLVRLAGEDPLDGQVKWIETSHQIVTFNLTKQTYTSY